MWWLADVKTDILTESRGGTGVLRWKEVKGALEFVGHLWSLVSGFAFWVIFVITTVVLLTEVLLFQFRVSAGDFLRKNRVTKLLFKDYLTTLSEYGDRSGWELYMSYAKIKAKSLVIVGITVGVVFSGIPWVMRGVAWVFGSL